MLHNQLEARQAARAREAEERAKERAVMLRETARLQEEELRAKVEKQLKAQQLIAEVRRTELLVRARWLSQLW